MERRHARYPFLASAREAVEAADVDIAAVVASEGPVVERARTRVETSLSEGHAGDGDPAGMHRSTRVELLSYPIARILVSLLEEPMAIDAYASAEAATARARLQADLPPPGAREEPELGGGRAGDSGLGGGGDGDAGLGGGGTGDSGLGGASDAGLGSGGTGGGGLGGAPPSGEAGGAAGGMSVRELLGEFGLEDRVDGRDPFDVDVATYLQLASDLDGDRWRLVDRTLADGAVTVDRAELYDLLQRAVAERVGEGLPLSVPPELADGLADPREDIEGMLADAEIPLAFDTVDPGLFPPCMEALLERARAGESLPSHSQYALVGFLGAAGMDVDAAVDLAGGGLDRETVAFQLDHVRDEDGLEYAPPSCATMDAYGDCVNKDDRCDTINHPLSYYESALSDAGAE